MLKNDCRTPITPLHQRLVTLNQAVVARGRPARGPRAPARWLLQEPGSPACALNCSVARTRAALMSGCVAECPAVSTIVSRACGHACARVYAVAGGQTRSRRPCT